MEQLDLLGAVDRKDDQVFLTPLGKKMAYFPLEPRFAKVSWDYLLAESEFMPLPVVEVFCFSVVNQSV